MPPRCVKPKKPIDASTWNVCGRPPHLESTDTVIEPPPQAAEVQLLEIFVLLKERSDVMRRHSLAIRLEAARVRAMRHGSSASSQELPDLSKTSWRALPRIDVAHPCPNCELSLRPFPPGKNMLLICANCGFVVKSRETRRARPSKVP
jgi:hypothetical protein